MSRALRVALVALLASGCASKLPRVPELLSIDPPRRPPAPARGRVISVQGAEVAALYTGSLLVYRVGEHAVVKDPYASLAAPPASMLTSAIRGYVAAADFVRDVVAPGDGLAADALVQPSVVELAGDFVDPAHPVAVLTLQLRVLLPTSAPGAPRAALLKTYGRRLPLSRRSAKVVVAAWNEGLGEIMTEFLKDLQGLLASGGPPAGTPVSGP